ncbi:MAG: LOG family protein [Acidobacteriota bacterium]|nr:LOG family protein [Acidobacteriota bacterium]MDE3043824.1 LOG family protein [Acidobacteriota bacterium]MDE3106718.1 LOG family protein [Acidobacteriota bacterium]MDE3223210.1 LOG family protein [Acidobacteriota bacterium]
MTGAHERAINQLLDSFEDPDRRQVVHEMLERVADVGPSAASTADLEVAATALNELLEAAELFGRFETRRKLAVFGSARTPVDSPLYLMAQEFSGAMAARGWMTVSGAGPGIMEASSKGAGIDNTLGVNIDLPFEQGSNPYIDVESRLVAMKYFFTRKVAMTRPANAFVIFPGGLGTMDEVFEVLTLLHTGKTTPAPVVLMDVPGGTFWQRWRAFLDDEVVAGNYVDEDGVNLARSFTNVEDGVAEIERFYSNYQGFALADYRGSLRLKRPPSPSQVAELRRRFPAFNGGAGILVSAGQQLEFAFDGRHYASLRQLIDVVNTF